MLLIQCGSRREPSRFSHPALEHIVPHEPPPATQPSEDLPARPPEAQARALSSRADR